MDRLFLIKLFLCLALLSGICNGIKAQCSGCTITYASSTSSNISVNSGQTVCINSGVTMSGQVTLSGGLLCNSGVINDFRINSGRVHNYGSINNTQSFIGFTSNTYIYCFSASQFSFSTVSLSNGGIDSIYFNVGSGAGLHFASDLSSSGGKLSIVNSGTFNVGSDLNVNNGKLLLVNSGIFNVSSSINLSNTGNKATINTGTVTVGNSINVGGNGSSAAVVTIWNSKLTKIGDALDCSMINGDFYMKNSATCSLGTDLVLTEVTDTLRNLGVLTVSNNIITNEGIIYNDSILNCLVDFDIDKGKFNNYNQTNVNNTFLIRAGSEVRNQGLLITGDFNNSGKFRFGTQGLLQTVNYYHAAGDTIFGAALTVTDTVQYARMIITGYSRNTGHVRNNLMVFDQSLVHTPNNIGYGFDSVTTGGNISGTVLFYERTLTPGLTGVLVPYVPRNFYFASALASSYTVACGSPVTLAGLFYAPYTSHSPVAFGSSQSPLYMEFDIAPSSYLWNPGGMSGQNPVV